MRFGNCWESVRYLEFCQLRTVGLPNFQISRRWRRLKLLERSTISITDSSITYTCSSSSQHHQPIRNDQEVESESREWGCFGGIFHPAQTRKQRCFDAFLVPDSLLSQPTSLSSRGAARRIFPPPLELSKMPENHDSHKFKTILTIWAKNRLRGFATLQVEDTTITEQYFSDFSDSLRS